MTFFRRNQLRLAQGDLFKGVRIRTSHNATWLKVKQWLTCVSWLFLLILTYVFVALVDQLGEARAEAANAKASVEPALRLLQKCLSPGDNPIYIGDELHMCGTAPTGIKVK